MNFSSKRFAHEEGLTFLCADRGTIDSERFLSGGADGDVRLWGEGGVDLDDDEPIDFRVGDQCHGIAWHGSSFYAAVRNGSKYVLQTRGYPSGDASTILSNFNLTPTCVDVAPSGKYVAVGSCKCDVKWIPIGSVTEYRCYEGHNGPILSVAIDPKEEFLASSSCDGTVKIWAVDSDSYDAVKTFDDMIATHNDFSAERTLAHMSWSADGRRLLIPVRGAVVAFQRSTWKPATPASFVDAATTTETYSVACVSPCGEWLAASTLLGTISVWRTADGALMSSGRFEEGDVGVICSLLWHPTNKAELLFTDTKGNICSARDLDDHLGAIEVDDDEAGVSRPTAVDDEMSKNSYDISALKARYEPVIFGESADNVNDYPASTHRQRRQADVSLFGASTSSWQPPKLPSAFTSGSTHSKHAKERYLKYNSVGAIRLFQSEDDNSIEVEFHDSTVHALIYINNSDRNYTMGDLSTEAVALAASSNIEQDAPSLLDVRYFAAWDVNSREWNVEMPKGEEIVSVSLGDRWLAVYTSMGHIRVFSLSGVQLALWTSQGGHFITMASWRGRLALCYVQSAMYDGEKTRFVYDIYQYDVSCTGSLGPIQKQQLTSLSLMSGVTLEWLGYTLDTGTLCAYDSKGRCVFCKGSRHPYFVPRPTLIVLDWSVPVCEANTDKGGYEASMLLQNFKRGNAMPCLDGEQNEASVKAAAECVLYLFRLAIKANNECRALDVGRLMPNSMAVQMLIEYATKLRRTALADKLADVARLKLREEENEGERSASPPPPHPSSHRRRTADGSDEGGDDSDEVELKPLPTNLRRNQVANPLLASIDGASSSENRLPISALAGHRNSFKRAATASNADEMPHVAAKRSVFDLLGTRRTEKTTLPSQMPVGRTDKWNKRAKTSATSVLSQQSNAKNSEDTL